MEVGRYIVKRILFTFASILMLIATNVYAEPALIINNNKCTILDGNGNIYSTNLFKKVVNTKNDPDGVSIVNMKCHATGVPNSTGTSVKYSFENTGFPCMNSEFGLITYTWKETVDVDGNAVFTCKFRN
jgi:hypothetical protein